MSERYFHQHFLFLITTVQADIFSAAMTMYFIMSGRLPYYDQPLHMESLIRLITSSDMRPRIDVIEAEKMRPLLQMCWAFDPVDRPSAPEIFAWLASFHIEILDKERKEVNFRPFLSKMVKRVSRVLHKSQSNTALDTMAENKDPQLQLKGRNPSFKEIVGRQQAVGSKKVP